MLKNILKLNGAQELKKNEQKAINGGFQNLCLIVPNACAPQWIHLCEEYC